jgi:hypothetical protein
VTAHNLADVLRALADGLEQGTAGAWAPDGAPIGALITLDAGPRPRCYRLRIDAAIADGDSLRRITHAYGNAQRRMR